MESKNRTTNWKQIAIALVVMAALLVGVICLYSKFGPKTQEGMKDITITVIDNNQKSTVYELRTDAKTLQEAMDDAEGLTYGCAEDQTSTMVDTVNGVKADYAVDASYWGFYVNGEYCQYGIATQPVADKDAFEIIYESGAYGGE